MAEFTADRAGPEKWVDLVNVDCDLDLAFSALKGWDHFYTNALRGRLKSLQLKPEEAWKYFKKAELQADLERKSPKDLLRNFYLKFYCFENALIEESVSGEESAVLKKYLNEIIKNEIPDSVEAYQICLLCHGIYHLNKGNYQGSKRVLKRLIGLSRNVVCDEKAGFYLAIAVAFYGAKELKNVNKYLESASICIPALKSKFNMGLYAGITSALLRILKREKEAMEWDCFIENLKIPSKTIDLFKERSKRILEMTACRNRIFIF